MKTEVCIDIEDEYVKKKKEYNGKILSIFIFVMLVFFSVLICNVNMYLCNTNTFCIFTTYNYIFDFEIIFLLLLLLLAAVYSGMYFLGCVGLCSFEFIDVICVTWNLLIIKKELDLLEKNIYLKKINNKIK